MFQIRIQRLIDFLFSSTACAALMVLASTATLAQQSTAPPATTTEQSLTTTVAITTAVVTPTMPKPISVPVYSEYRGIKIGMHADDVRNTLKKLQAKGERQDFFQISNDEMAQVYYDTDGKVRALTVNYTDNLKDAPTPQSVFGEPLAANADGSLYRMVRYPEAGYWVSYNHTGGDDAIITITVQKIRHK